ncbi:ABC transporter substrate-binding protein [Paenibacillus sp. CAU 1782]
MKSVKRIWGLAAILLLTTVLAAACGNAGSTTGGNASASPQATASQESAAPAESTEPASTTRSMTDSQGNTAEIPVKAERVVFWGETVGDMLKLGIKPIGTTFSFVDEHIYEDEFKDVVDVGFPISLETLLELQPDLIITASMDANEYEQLSKIAPTLVFDTFAPIKERMLLLGDILGRSSEAEAWLASYDTLTASIKEELKKVGVTGDETISVLTYYPGDRLFAMARAGLSQVLIDDLDLAPTPHIQKMIDEDKGFEELSMEVLPALAGDLIFVLNPVSTMDDAVKSTEAMMKSNIWLNLPAVKAGKVYTLDIRHSSSDASTREWLLQKMPELITNKQL